MGKTLTRKTPSSEFEVTTLVDSTKKEKKKGYKYKESYPTILSWSTYLQYNLLSYTSLNSNPQLDLIL